MIIETKGTVSEANSPAVTSPAVKSYEQGYT